MKFLRGIKGFVLYLMAGYFFDRQDLEKARKWMDRSNASDSAFDAYMVATDAILYVLEGKVSEAVQRFGDCLELVEIPQSPNHEFLKIFSRFWLKAYNDHTLPDELEAMAIEASHLPVDRWLKRRFRFPPHESIRKNVRVASSNGAAVAFDI